jgi:endo-1,4-beta-xylanase
MKMWQSRPTLNAARSPGGASRRRMFTAGAATAATLAAMATLAIGGSAQAALAPGTPLKTLAAANGNRYFGSDMTGDLVSNSNVTQLQAQQFNMLTPGNEMKWQTIEPNQNQFNFGPGDQIVQYAHANGERYRGHNLVWDSQLAGWVTQIPLNQVQAAMENHITKEVSHYATVTATMPQTPYAWDVVNEPFQENGSLKQDVFFNAMGSGYIADALRTAHAADPNAKLYLNDFNIEGMNAKSNAMFSLAQSLLAAGAPLNGIGFESHFIEGQNPSGIQANMQRFANLGLDVAVTELDDRFTSLPPSNAGLQQQATDFANTVKACLGITRCVGVTQWAIGDPDSWVPGAFSGQGAATMFDQSYAPKPAFTAVQTALGATAGNTVTVTNPGARTGTVGTATSLQISATDSAAGQTLTFSATGLPAGLTISSSGLISGTPTTNQTANVTVTARDGTNASGSASFTWTISGGTGNTVTVTNPGARTGTVGTATSLQISATDSAAGQTLTFSATGLPAGLTISSSGLISGTPTTNQTANVTVTARDGTNASGSASFTWTISGGTTGGTCHVTYTRNSEWPGNFTAQVVIQNTGTSAINGWSLTFTFPGDQKVTANFNGGFSMSGENATLTNASYNGTIAPGSSITDGFQGTFSSNDASPTSFAVNGTACS